MTDRIESDREAVYLWLYGVWPEWRTGVASERSGAALVSLCADGRVEVGPYGYRVRMGLS